tara:strand:- start:300 stop:434 length:135 start_codon:yes stop_codon:yes gene_type:complete
MGNKRIQKLESKLIKITGTMELIRTVVPLLVLILQIIVLVKLLE